MTNPSVTVHMHEETLDGRLEAPDDYRALKILLPGLEVVIFLGRKNARRDAAALRRLAFEIDGRK